MKKVVWTKFWTRNFGLFRYWVYIESNRLPFYRENFGKVFDYTLTVPNGKLMEYYHDEQELKDITNKIFAKSCQDFKTFERYSQQIIGWMQEFIDFNNQLNIKQLKSADREELVSIYKVWYQKYLHWQVAVYFYFVLEPILSEVLLPKLESYLQKHNLSDKLNYYNNLIMSPEKMNAVALEQKMALETAIKVKKEPSRKDQLVNEFYKKFLWLPCYDIKDEEYQIDYFEDKIDKLLLVDLDKLKKQLLEFENEYKHRKQLFAREVAQIKESRLVNLAKIMHWLVYYKDHRDDKRREAGYAGKNFMRVLADRLSLTLEEINYLTPPELLDWLENDRGVTKLEIKKRIPANYVLLCHEGKTNIFTGTDEIDDVLDQELAKNQNINNQIIKGVIGSKGNVQGPAVIVRHSISLNKVKPGDILVAVTTHPEYVPAMKKCSAIITDEGGITSHAAIVARELKLPCIVGAKIATQSLKDGDLIEVNADRGTVKIIK